jgi:hypothetical protein
MTDVVSRLFAVQGPVFVAKYPGKCWRCGQRFPVGERIRYIAKKTVAHEACAVPSGPINPVNDPVLGAEEWAARHGQEEVFPRHFTQDTLIPSVSVAEVEVALNH